VPLDLFIFGMEQKKWQKWQVRAKRLLLGFGALGLIGLVVGLQGQEIVLDNLQIGAKIGVIAYGGAMVAGGIIWITATSKLRRLDDEIRDTRPSP